MAAMLASNEAMHPNPNDKVRTKSTNDKEKSENKPNSQTTRQTQTQKEQTKMSRSKFRGGGYVLNERNQLQENSTVLFGAPRCGDTFESMVYDSKTS
jgi:FtsZ-interacting cell division protein YlmF